MCDIESLRYSFQKFDKDGDGLLSVDELYNTFLSMGHNVSKEVIEKSLPAGSKTINFDTFCAMSKAQTGITAAPGAQASPEDQMMQMFRLFDTDNDGSITLSELRIGMVRLGEFLPPGEIEKIMDAADTNKDGVISFQEFCDIMKAF